ncbi:unnamed protein product [Larinioides sclopetarius]|uniref:Uncharacterized protein n=1 Tax=Larinioides sclopetarius TaxID=280406 RepID=A0AAV2BL90_9ARAC
MKMLLYICLVLGVWRGVTGKHVVCSKPTHQVCNTIGDATFPKTEADFDQICNELIKHLDCLEDYSNKCVFNGDLQLLSGMRDVVEDACRNDSSLHLQCSRLKWCESPLYPGIDADLMLETSYSKWLEELAPVQAKTVLRCQ